MNKNILIKFILILFNPISINLICQEFDLDLQSNLEQDFEVIFSIVNPGFYDSQYLRDLENVGEAKNKCNICGKCLTRPEGLRNHLKTHSKKKDYKCELCLKDFYRKDHLRDHIANIHKKKKKYKCEICKKLFFKKSNFNSHNNSCRGIKSFVCPFGCNSYMYKRQLNSHLKDKHNSF